MSPWSRERFDSLFTSSMGEIGGGRRIAAMEDHRFILVVRQLSRLVLYSRPHKFFSGPKCSFSNLMGLKNIFYLFH